MVKGCFEQFRKHNLALPVSEFFVHGDKKAFLRDPKASVLLDVTSELKLCLVVCGSATGKAKHCTTCADD